MYIKEGNHFPGKQKFDSKTQDRFDNLQQNAFSKASHKRNFLGNFYKKTPGMKFTWKPS